MPVVPLEACSTRATRSTRPCMLPVPLIPFARRASGEWREWSEWSEWREWRGTTSNPSPPPPPCAVSDLGSPNESVCSNRSTRPVPYPFHSFLLPSSSASSASGASGASGADDVNSPPRAAAMKEKIFVVSAGGYFSQAQVLPIIV